MKSKIQVRWLGWVAFRQIRFWVTEHDGAKMVGGASTTMATGTRKYNHTRSQTFPSSALFSVDSGSKLGKNVLIFCFHQRVPASLIIKCLHIYFSMEVLQLFVDCSGKILSLIAVKEAGFMISVTGDRSVISNQDQTSNSWSCMCSYFIRSSLFQSQKASPSVRSQLQ